MAASQLTMKTKMRQKQKFDHLLDHTRRMSRQTQRSKKWVVNLSSRVLTETERSALALSLNFAPAPRLVPVPQLVAAVEDGLQRLKASQVEKEAAKNSIVGILKKSQPPVTPHAQHTIKCQELPRFCHLHFGTDPRIRDLLVL